MVITMEGRDRRVLAFVLRHLRTRGYAPTVREIAASVPCSPSSVHASLARLQQRGIIIRRPGVARSLIVSTPDVHPSLIERLEDLADSFEIQATHLLEYIVDEPLTHELERVRTVGAFTGYALGLRRAVALIAIES